MFPVTPVPTPPVLPAPPEAPPRRLLASLGDHLEALRPHHWIKNLLVFLPLAVSHELHELPSLQRGVAAFIAFSLCASGVYLMNDVLDVETDRRHPLKRLRPLASGRVSRTACVVMLAVVLALGLLTASWISMRVVAAVVVYFAIMTVYSMWAKRAPILDVILLASGYALRVVVGSLAARLAPEQWLLAFCMFLFFSLALIKRYAELVTSIEAFGERGHALGYGSRDAPPILAMGISASYLAVLVLALDTRAGLAGRPGPAQAVDWMVCVLLFFWVSYLWLMAHREQIREDPVLYAIKDRGSLIPLVLIAGLTLAGT